MIDFIVGFFAVIFFLAFYLYIGYWFLDLKTLPADHWVSRSANRVRAFFAIILEPMRNKTRRLDVRILLVLDNLVMRLTNADYILLLKKLWAGIVIVYLKTVLFVLKLKKLFFEKNEDKR